MRPISDALELLTAQHEEIDDLLVKVQQTGDAAAFDQLADKLVAHLALEQEMFYPVIATTISRDVLHEVLQEHGAIKRVLAEMVWVGVEDPTFGAKLAELSFLLGGHSAWQEEELFLHAAESLSPDILSTLGNQLQSFDTQYSAAA